MARVRASRRKEKPTVLGPGMHAGVIEMHNEGSFRIRLLDGTRVKAALGDGVDPALAQECLRDGRTVMLAETSRGPVVLGALQTTRSLERTPDGTLVLEARRIRLRAQDAVIVQAGEASLRVQADGTVCTEGESMLIDMSSNVRVLSALVELP
jgi:translation initiation factor IF-1